MLTILIVLVSVTLKSQNSVSAVGTSDFSLSEYNFTGNTDPNYYVIVGVQQPYEISTTTSIVDLQNNINLNYVVFPNPTANYINLKVSDNADLHYKIYDVAGNSIENKEIANTETTIDLKNYANATYFLKIFKNNVEIKTFKIIKNK